MFFINSTSPNCFLALYVAIASSPATYLNNSLLSVAASKTTSAILSAEENVLGSKPANNFSAILYNLDAIHYQKNDLKSLY